MSPIAPRPCRVAHRRRATLLSVVLLGSPAAFDIPTANASEQTGGDARPPALKASAEERDLDVSAIRAVDTEQWESALQLTLSLIDGYSAKAPYLARLALVYNRLHRPVDEVATWERFMEVSPRPGQACPMIGKAYRGLGQYDHAITAFTRCLEADPKNATLVYYVGLGNEWAGEFGAAREFYEQAIAMAPPGYESRVSIARLELHQNALTAARDRAVAVLTQVPTHVEAALVAGLAEQRAGRRAEARRYLQQAATLSPEYFDVRLALGILEYSESRIPEARGHFEAAFLADPSRRADVQPWLDRTANAK